MGPIKMDKAERLKLAVQKSGRLTDNSLDLLVRCGLKFSRGKDQLMCYGENMPLDVLFVRDDDIPDLVQEDVSDLGLVGLNVIEEKRLELAARGAVARFTVLRQLDFGRCRLSHRGAGGLRLRGPASRSPASASRRRIPTSSRAISPTTASRPRSSRCRARSKSRRASAAPMRSATSSRPARRWSPTTCAKSRPCSRARRC